MRLATSAVLLAGLLLLGTPPGRSAGSTAAAPSLGSLERAYAQHLLVSRPDRGSREGVKGAAARLVPVTRASLARDSEWLRGFRARCDQVDAARLTPAARTRLDSLLARVARQQDESRPDGPLLRDPVAYRALTDQAVLEAITAPRVGECERVRRATQRLRMVPEVLRAAAINLRGAPHDDARLQAGVADAVRRLRTEVIAAAAACRDPGRSADLVEADSAAIRAFEVFPLWLHNAPERAR